MHGDRYDYSQVEYKDTRTNVVITCRTHGDFEQRPDNHTSNGRPHGCTKCGNSAIGRGLVKTTDKFISDSIEAWGDRYCYSLTEYNHSHSHVLIECKEHGHVFEQTPTNHLAGNQGCLYCSSTNRGAGMVYLIEIHVPETDEKFIKIGWTTSNVRTRFSKDDFDWKQLNRKMFPNAFLGERWERYMHKMFDDCRYKPKHRFGGETECFGYQYKELIQKTFAEEAKRGN